MAGTVTVALKLPHGLILRIFEMRLVKEPVFGGGWREIEFAHTLPQRVRLNGYAAPWGMAPNAPVIGGYALTHNVDADFFAKWLEQNKDSNLVKNRLIFGFPREADAAGEARKNEALRNGLEPLDPDKPPQQFRHSPARPGIGAVTKATPGAS